MFEEMKLQAVPYGSGPRGGEVGGRGGYICGGPERRGRGEEEREGAAFMSVLGGREPVRRALMQPGRKK